MRDPATAELSWIDRRGQNMSWHRLFTKFVFEARDVIIKGAGEVDIVQNMRRV